MLWTDRDFISVADLLAADSSAARIASVETIVLDGETGVIRQQIGEAGADLLVLLQQYQTSFTPLGITSAHMQAVLGPYSQVNARAALSQIVVSDARPGYWSPIKRWVLYRVLGALYQQASERQEGDRYGRMWARTAADVETRYQPFLFTSGLPVVVNPIACPGAEAEPGSGVWNASALSAIDGGSGIADQPLQVALSFVGSPDLSALAPNSESALSRGVAFTLPIGKQLIVSRAGVNPIQTQPPSTIHQAVYYPRVATGWNVYVAGADGVFWLQTAQPLPLATMSVTLSVIANSGVQAGTGQIPDAALTMQRVMFRG